MINTNQDENGSSSRNNEINQEAADYLRMARCAVESGQFRLAVYLYLASFEQDCKGQSTPSPAALAGLRKAWSHACDLKDRALAEHIFEKLEPYSSSEAVAEYSCRLQALALEKLGEFGFSQDEVENMADILSEEFSAGADFLSQLGASMMAPGKIQDSSDESAPKIATIEAGLVLPAPFGKAVEKRASKQAEKKPADNAAPAKKEPAAASSDSDLIEMPAYEDLIGYDAAVESMKAYGIGVGNDQRFKQFLDMLSRRHGISNLPSTGTMLFRSAAREDATHFMHATVGELNMPSVRMYMQTTSQGVSMLCVMASTDFKSRFQFMQSGFDKPAVVVLEDVDLWAEPLAGIEGEISSDSTGQVARGAKEAFSMIRMAVENPNVIVLASCSIESSPASLFFGLLEPANVIDIDVPTREERAAVWKDVTSMYPSLRYLDLEDLVRLSDSLTRADIYAAAREAVEQAYRESIEKHAYVPVTSDNLNDKIAACQPLDSEQYKEIQDQALDSFRKDLEHIDDLLKGDF